MHRPTLIACTAFVLGLAAAVPAQAEVATELLTQEPGKWKSETMAMQEPRTTEPTRTAETCMPPRTAETCIAPRAPADMEAEAAKDRPRQSLQQALRSGH